MNILLLMTPARKPSAKTNMISRIVKIQ